MKNLFAFLSLLTCVRATAQDSLQHFADARNRTMLTGMKVLGSWGAVNLAGGGIGWATAGGSNKYFYQMSTFWGGVNLAIAALGFSSAKRKMQQPLTAAENLKTQKKLETTFFVNGGLDLVYTGAGLYMKTRGGNKGNAILQGYGSSVVLQGIFLFLFDGIMYKLQRNNGIGLKRFLNNNSVTLDSKAIGIIHRL